MPFVRRHPSLLAVIAIAAAPLVYAPPPSGAAPLPSITPVSSRAVCSDTRPGYAHCLAEFATPIDRGVSALSTRVQKHKRPVGWKPKQLATAYKLHWSNHSGAGQTIAIVDAFDSPNIGPDLGMFSKAYKLPPCSLANHCLTKLNQDGNADSFPAVDEGWALEINLDVEWAHAMAPAAKIVLVEADDASYGNLMAAEATAKNLAGVRYLSNSWGSQEFPGESAYDSAWQPNSNQTVFFSAGDNGAQATWPSASPSVVSVGGTSLRLKGGKTIETAWSYAGGGCSAYETASGPQAAFATYGQVHCDGHRATPDLSAVAGPDRDAGVYTSTPSGNQVGWIPVDGTSFSAPVLAGITARTGLTLRPASIYGMGFKFRDIAHGSNGQPCMPGYDLCSGRGTWINSQSFHGSV